MQYQFVTRIWVASFIVLGFLFPAMANDRNLIQTLYHAEFVPDAEDDAQEFSLDGELGMLFATGNTAASTLKAGLNSEHETRHWSNTYFAELLYKEIEIENDGKKEDKVTAERFFGYAQFDYKLDKPGQRMFMYGDYENDAFNGYDYRASLAAGWSQRLWQDEDAEFRYSVGPGYSFVAPEEGKQSTLNNGIIVRASAEYRYEWTSEAKFRQFISTEAGDDNIKSRSETSISANLFGSLAMKLSITLNHETGAPDDAEELNTETSVSLLYRFF